MKKTLALVLALVMVIGLMAVPVKADFTDSSAIEYTEAVDVLSAVGVINGFENGSFDPAGNLTREQAAKIVAYLMLGEDNADALVATSAPFGDVAADRWSAGYIAYCVNEGIINGRDAKTFDPTGKVTGYEFAKLLLGCLGYSSKIEQYVGASWAINVAKTALDIDLFDGNDGANYNAPMTREEAALYAFNTLKATLVDYDSQGTSIDLGNGVIISTGASKAQEVEIAKDKATIAGTLNAAGTVQFAEKYFGDLEYAEADRDDFNRPASSWIFDGEDVGTYAEEADLTYTAAVKGSAVYSDLGKPDADATAYTYYVDGVKKTTVTDYADDLAFLVESGNDNKLGDNGILVEIFERDVAEDEVGQDGVTDATEAYDVILINTYVGQITNWVEADEDDDKDEYVTVSALGDGVSDDFETTVFTEDDADDETVVLYTYSDKTDEIKSVVAAESATAAVTKVTGTSSFVAGGTTYKYSSDYASAYPVYASNADDSLIYLDTYGYVAFIDELPDATDNYAYLMEGIESEGLFDETFYAKLLLPTGEVKVVEIENETGFDSAQLVSYTVDDDDVYELATVASAEADVNEDITIEKGKTTIALAGDASAITYANSKTIFVVASEDDDETIYTAYTGIANVPSLKATADGQYVVLPDEDNSKLASIVYVLKADETGTSADDLTYVAMESISKLVSDANGKYYTVNAVVDGELTTLNLDAKLFAAAAASGIPDDIDTPDVDESVIPAGTLYGEGDVLIDSYTTNSKGVVTKVTLTADEDFTADATTQKAANGLVGFGGTAGVAPENYAFDLFGYDDDTVVYTVDADGVIAKSSISAIKTDYNNTVIFTQDEDTDAVVVAYVTVVDGAGTIPTL